MNCYDKLRGSQLLYHLRQRLWCTVEHLPAAGTGDMVMTTVKKGKPELKEKVIPAVVVGQSMPWRRADSVYLYFEDNAGAMSNCSRKFLEMKQAAGTKGSDIIQ